MQMGFWNVFQTISLGLEQVVKLGEANTNNHSENTLHNQKKPFVNNFVSSLTNKNSSTLSSDFRESLKRSYPSSVESVQPAKRRLTHNCEEDFTSIPKEFDIQNLAQVKRRKLSFLETVRRKRNLKLYRDKIRNLRVENFSEGSSQTLENSLDELTAANLSRPKAESQSASQSNYRLEAIRKQEKLSLQKEIDMLKQRIQQLQRQEKKQVGLLIASNDSESMLEQKLLLSTTKFLDKAVFHQEAFQRSEDGLLQLRSKSAIHKNRAIFFAEQVRKGLESVGINKTDTEVAVHKSFSIVERHDEKKQQLNAVIELSDSSDDDELVDNVTDESEDVELLDELLSSLSEDCQVVNISEVDERDPLSPLSAKALMFCKYMLKEPKNRLLVSRDGMKITRNDLRLLLPGNWLNDEVINFYMSLLQERNEKSICDNGYSKCLFLSSFFFIKLLSGGHYDYNAVRKWTHHVNVFEYDKVIIPINIKNCHWILAVIDIEGKRFICLDSIRGSHMKRLQALRQWLYDEYRTKLGLKLETDKYSFEQPDVPRQSNVDDCGVFCCKFAHYVSSNWKLTFSAENMNYFRWRMMLEILCQRVS
ncbi:Sentrin-specific protease 2 [Galdieria sulphuraria]|nr:Sentrin-specific protease 2 [Galdieria sulphuraria]